MKNSLSNDVISVIVPVYNVESYLHKCINSIINQSYSNLQIILVNDGSTDHSGEICDQYEQLDYRVEVIHKENGGLTTARRAGMGIASGKYIGFVDADDYIDHEMYKTLYTVAEQYQADFVHSGYFEDSEDKILCAPKKIKHYKNVKKEELLSNLFSLYPDAELGPAIWPNIFSRELIIKCYSFVPDYQSYGEDLISMCCCIIKGSNFVSIPNAFYHYSKRNDSISNSISEKRFLDYYQLYCLLKEILIANNFQESIIRILKKRFILLAMQALAEQSGIYIPKYRYPDITGLKGKRIVLYGSGKVGQDFYYQISKYQDCNIIKWIDREEHNFDYATVQKIIAIQNLSYDIILIAVYDEFIAWEIQKNLVFSGVDKQKILWKKAILYVE